MSWCADFEFRGTQDLIREKLRSHGFSVDDKTKMWSSIDGRRSVDRTRAEHVLGTYNSLGSAALSCVFSPCLFCSRWFKCTADSMCESRIGSRASLVFEHSAHSCMLVCVFSAAQSHWTRSSRRRRRRSHC